MAKPLLPDELWERIRPLIPPHPPQPKGGRPPLDDRKVLTGIIFILKTGLPWEDLPQEMGCGCGMTGWNRLRDWQAAGVWDRIQRILLAHLRGADKLDFSRFIADTGHVRAVGGGEQTGPSPVDRRKKGSKHTLLVDKHGVPLAIRTAGANASDHTQIIPLVLDFPKVGGKPGRPKQRPDTLYADAGYDSEATRWLLAWLGIESHIGRRRRKHGSGLGKVRWVVERTIGWLKGLRRLRVRYDRLAIIQDAWTTLAASVICFRLLHEAAA